MKIFTYWRSLATFRVRMALNLKGLAPEGIEVDLHAGAQLKPEFAAINPMRAIPVLIDDDGTTLHQSLPIMEYLDERYPDPPLMPADAAGRARVRALAQITVADSHPLVVPRVRSDLASRLSRALQRTPLRHVEDNLELRFIVEGQHLHRHPSPDDRGHGS